MNRLIGPNIIQLPRSPPFDFTTFQKLFDTQKNNINEEMSDPKIGEAKLTCCITL
jgi:hypothetical protein